MESINNKTLEKLKYALVREGLISYEDLTKAENLVQESSINLSQILISKGFIQEETLLKFIEAKLHIPYVNLDDYTIDEKSIALIKAEEAVKYKIIPLFKIEDVLTVAMGDPLDLFALNKFIEETNLKVEPVICSEKKIIQAIKNYYKHDLAQQEKKDQPKSWEEDLNVEKHDQEHGLKIIKGIILQAKRENAAEVSFDPVFNGLNVKFKFGNESNEKGNIPVLLAQICTSAIKTLSGLNPEISALPQLGKINIETPDAKINAGVSTFPTAKGERITVKIHKEPVRIDQLLKKEELEKFRNFTKNAGMVLVTGQNRQENISACYSIMAEMSKTKKCIIAVESISRQPVDGVYHCEINEKIGFDFDKILKHIEFQAPDTAYFEDIPTTEMLEYVLNAAENGILIISQASESGSKRIKNRAQSLNFDSDKIILDINLHY